MTLNRNISHLIETSDWYLNDTIELTPGMKYTYQVCDRNISNDGFEFCFATEYHLEYFLIVVECLPK